MRARHTLALLALAGISACSVIEPLTPPAEPTTAPAAGAVAKSSAEEIFAYVASIRGMGDGALVAEAARQKREANPLARVKAALALSLASQSEEGEILALVEPVARKENADGDLRAMAGFLQSLAIERRRLKESAASTGVRLRDERRAHETQKQRAEALQQKLDALTDLEKSLSDRQVLTR
jgi:hypothetical protein